MVEIPITPQEIMLTTQEVARLLYVNERTLIDWRVEGYGPKAYYFKYYFYFLEDVLEFLEKCRIKTVDSNDKHLEQFRWGKHVSPEHTKQFKQILEKRKTEFKTIERSGQCNTGK